MTVAQITLIEPQDITAAEVTCARCRVSINVLPTSQIPEICPSCNTQISAGTKQALRHFQKFVSEASHEGALERVRLVVPALPQRPA